MCERDERPGVVVLGDVPCYAATYIAEDKQRCAVGVAFQASELSAERWSTSICLCTRTVCAAQSDCLWLSPTRKLQYTAPPMSTKVLFSLVVSLSFYPVRHESQLDFNILLVVVPYPRRRRGEVTGGSLRLPVARADVRSYPM